MNIEIVKEIFSNYFPNLKVLNINAIGGGHINFTYMIECQGDNYGGKLVFQYLNPLIFPNPSAIWTNIRKIAIHLKNKNYQYQILDFHPQFMTLPESAWRVFPYFENTFTLEKCENKDLAYKAAKAFGHHFAMVSDMSLEGIETIIPKFHDANWRWQQFQASLKVATDERLALAENEIEFFKTNFRLVEQYNSLIKTLPQRITHNDTKISNLLFDSTTNHPFAIIDLDTLQIGTILSDFGDMVRSYCPNLSEESTDFEAIVFRKDIYDALKTGFLEETAEILNNVEKESLFFAGELTIYIQALRFLTDFLNNDVYYKVNNSHQNLNRSKNQIRLLEKMWCS